MSDKVRALVWDYYDERRFGAPMVLALAISDEADDRGGLFQSATELAKKTRQGERTVRAQLKALEASGLLTCVERSRGGPGQYSRYLINLPVFLTASNPAAGTGLTLLQEQGLPAPNPAAGTGFATPVIYNDFKEHVEGPAAQSRVADDVEDQRLAAWIFQRLQALNPKHREPSWPTWRKEIRLMRERDKRTRREIAALFAWANANPFWQCNVLSPSTLRRQWDRLELQRQRDGGRGVQAPAPTDRRCAWEKAGARCGADWFIRLPDGRGLCRKHQEEEERERASVQA